MKKLLASIALCFCINQGFTQDNLLSTNTDANIDPIDLKIDNVQFIDPSNYGYTQTPLGPIVLLGGFGLTLAGILTAADYECVHHNGKIGDGSSGYAGGCAMRKKPFFRQGPKAWAILSGTAIMGVGIVLTIGG